MLCFQWVSFLLFLCWAQSQLVHPCCRDSERHGQPGRGFSFNFYASLQTEQHHESTASAELGVYVWDFVKPSFVLALEDISPGQHVV